MEDFFGKKLNGIGTKRICHEIQIVFKSDPDLKEKTLEKAKTEGVTLKAVLTMAMRAYVNDEMVLGMWKREEFYDDKGDSPPVKKKKIKEGIKSPVVNIKQMKRSIKNYKSKITSSK
jgi:hypothetical protein